MDYGAFFVDETAAPVENAFLEFLKRFNFFFLFLFNFIHLLHHVISYIIFTFFDQLSFGPEFTASVLCI